MWQSISLIPLCILSIHFHCNASNAPEGDFIKLVTNIVKSKFETAKVKCPFRYFTLLPNEIQSNIASYWDLPTLSSIISSCLENISESSEEYTFLAEEVPVVTKYLHDNHGLFKLNKSYIFNIFSARISQYWKVNGDNKQKALYEIIKYWELYKGVLGHLPKSLQNIAIKNISMSIHQGIAATEHYKEIYEFIGKTYPTFVLSNRELIISSLVAQGRFEYISEAYPEIDLNRWISFSGKQSLFNRFKRGNTTDFIRLIAKFAVNYPDTMELVNKCFSDEVLFEYWPTLMKSPISFIESASFIAAAILSKDVNQIIALDSSRKSLITLGQIGYHLADLLKNLYISDRRDDILQLTEYIFSSENWKNILPLNMESILYYLAKCGYWDLVTKWWRTHFLNKNHIPFNKDYLFYFALCNEQYEFISLFDPPNMWPLVIKSLEMGNPIALRRLSELYSEKVKGPVMISREMDIFPQLTPSMKECLEMLIFKDGNDSYMFSVLNQSHIMTNLLSKAMDAGFEWLVKELIRIDPLKNSFLHSGIHLRLSCFHKALDRCSFNILSLFILPNPIIGIPFVDIRMNEGDILEGMKWGFLKNDIDFLIYFTDLLDRRVADMASAMWSVLTKEHFCSKDSFEVISYLIKYIPAEQYGSLFNHGCVWYTDELLTMVLEILPSDIQFDWIIVNSALKYNRINTLKLLLRHSNSKWIYFHNDPPLKELFSDAFDVERSESLLILREAMCSFYRNEGIIQEQLDLLPFNYIIDHVKQELHLQLNQ